MTACIVHYNTPELTAAAIRSLWKHTPAARVVVFDNSDRRPFSVPSGSPAVSVPSDFVAGAEVLDNTHSQLIDFPRWLATFPNKQPINNAYASAKHCYSVQWLIDHTDEPFLLMDSDVLICQDVAPLFDPRYAYVGEEKLHRSRFGSVMRVLPFLCYINVPMLKRHGVTFYNPRKMFALTATSPANAYDTGCWFYEDCRAHRLPVLNIPIAPYALHLGHASWKEKDYRQWLRENRRLWE